MAPRKKKEKEPKEGNENFPVIGLWASAGGRKLSVASSAMPVDTGMAFIRARHIKSGHVGATWWVSF